MGYSHDNVRVRVALWAMVAVAVRARLRLGLELRFGLRFGVALGGLSLADSAFWRLGGTTLRFGFAL